MQIAPPQATELTIKGRILNRRTNELMTGATVRYGGENIADNTIKSENGYFSLKIPKGVTFQLIPEKGGFTGTPKSILFRRDYYFFQDYYTYDLYLEPLAEGAVIELRPIYFVQSKAEILEPSFPELQRLADILKENPDMHIRIEGHTDNIGKVEDLQQLSEQRAIAVKTFLIEQGIAQDRIDTMGFGAQNPINDNSSEELRQLNRRVEVRITKLQP